MRTHYTREDTYTRGNTLLGENVIYSVALPLSYCYHSYEPELFPGLIYRMVKPRIVLLIFVSGKVVLTGEGIFTYVHTKAHLLLQVQRKETKSMKLLRTFIPSSRTSRKHDLAISLFVHFMIT